MFFYTIFSKKYYNEIIRNHNGVMFLYKLGCSGTFLLTLLIIFMFVNWAFTLALAAIIVIGILVYVFLHNQNRVKQAKLNSAQTIDAAMSKETSFQFNSMVYRPIISPNDDVPNKEMIMRTDQMGYVKSSELSKREQNMKNSGYSMENIRVARIQIVQSYNVQYHLFNRYYDMLQVEADVTTVPNREMTILIKQMVMSFYHKDFGLNLSLQNRSFDEGMIKKFVNLCPDVNMSIRYFDNNNITNEEFLNEHIDKGCLNAFRNIMIGYNL